MLAAGMTPCPPQLFAHPWPRPVEKLQGVSALGRLPTPVHPARPWQVDVLEPDDVAVLEPDDVDVLPVSPAARTLAASRRRLRAASLPHPVAWPLCHPPHSLRHR